MNISTNEKHKIVIVMPAYNASGTLKDTFYEIPLALRKNIMLVDDQSSDNTVNLAKSLGIKVFKHNKNLGYGGNQKTCYREALKVKADIVVMLHPDYQYDASLTYELIRPIKAGRFDFMFGSRIQTKSAALKGGMPSLKYYLNRIFCLVENILLGVNFTEHFSGFRAYSSKLLRKIPFENFSNDFVFDQQMTISAISFGFKIGEIAIPTRYHSKASSIKYLKGAKFLFETCLYICLFKLHKMGMVRLKIFK